MFPNLPANARKGFTLLEMTIVIMVLIALIGIGLFSSRKLDEWKLGRSASETLRGVYAAQRMYLADHPTTPVASITAANLLPYLVGTPQAMPTVRSLTGQDLPINFNLSPPVVSNGAGATYDPSGNASDSLWDVGQ